MLGEPFQLRRAVIEVVVAGSHCVDARRVEERHETFALADCDNGHTVKSVAGVEPKRRGIFGFSCFDRRRHFRQPFACASVVGVLNARMHVVGVEDNQLRRRADRRVENHQGNQDAEKLFKHENTSEEFLKTLAKKDACG